MHCALGFTWQSVRNTVRLSSLSTTETDSLPFTPTVFEARKVKKKKKKIKEFADFLCNSGSFLALRQPSLSHDLMLQRAIARSFFYTQHESHCVCGGVGAVHFQSPVTSQRPLFQPYHTEGWVLTQECEGLFFLSRYLLLDSFTHAYDKVLPTSC